jgi:hypothetical protein
VTARCCECASFHAYVVNSCGRYYFNSVTAESTWLRPTEDTSSAVTLGAWTTMKVCAPPCWGVCVGGGGEWGVPHLTARSGFCNACARVSVRMCELCELCVGVRMCVCAYV